MPLQPTVLVEVELAGVGGGWTNIIADVRLVDGVTFRSGVLGSGPSDLVASTGTLSFALRNDAKNSASLLGYYSLYHANKRSGWGLGIGCRLRLTDPNTATTYTRFVGRISAIDPEPGVSGPRVVRVMAVDWMDEAARWDITPDVGEQVELSWDAIVTNILAEMPAQPTATSFDVGMVLPYALDSSGTKQKALAEFQKLAASERGYVYITRAGTLKLENRHARLLDTTVDWTLTDTSLVSDGGITVPSSRDDIINTVRVTTHPKIVDDFPTTVVYSQANTIAVAGGGGTKSLLGPYRDPATGDAIGAKDIQAQVAGVDYVANANADGSGTDRTSDFTVVVTAGPAGARFLVTNNHADVAYLTVNQLIGRGIYDRGAQQFEATDSASIATHGERVSNIDMPYQANDDVGLGAATYYLEKYKDPFAAARTATVVAKTNAVLAHVLQRDVSDRLAVSETLTGVNDEFFINGISMTIMSNKHVEVTYTLAPAIDPYGGAYWILGTSTLGTDTTLAPF